MACTQRLAAIVVASVMKKVAESDVLLMPYGLRSDTALSRDCARPRDAILPK
jgi:hypothetical protein